MISLFLILTVLNLLCLLCTAVLGYGNSVASEWGGYHQLARAGDHLLLRGALRGLHVLHRNREWIERGDGEEAFSRPDRAHRRLLPPPGFPAAILPCSVSFSPPSAA